MSVLEAENSLAISLLHLSQEAILNSNSCLALLRADGGFTYASPGWRPLLGYEADDLLGKSLYDITYQDDRTVLYQTFLQLIETGSAGSLICRLQTTTSEMLWGALMFHPLRHSQTNKVEEIIVRIEDISERKRAEEKAKQKQEIRKTQELAEAASQVKSAILANMSHELRTPLNAIIGYAEMLQEEVEILGHANLVPDLLKIQTAGRQLLSVLTQLLDLSKLEAGQVEFYPETFYVDSLVDDLATALQPLIEKKHNTLHLQIDANTGTMFADQTKVRQILYNLLSNAAKFTDKGSIIFSVHREKLKDIECIRFTVQDTGIGITPEQMKTLFTDFRPVDFFRTGRFSGTGLGLSIVRRFCHLMDGEIFVESTPDEGSTFTVYLPAEPLH